MVDRNRTNVLKSQPMILSVTEAKLVALFADMKFGRVLDVEIPDEPKTDVRYLEPPVVKFIEIVRGGAQNVKEIVVHEGQPTYVEIEGREPFRHIRRMKI